MVLYGLDALSSVFLIELKIGQKTKKSCYIFFIGGYLVNKTQLQKLKVSMN